MIKISWVVWIIDYILIRFYARLLAIHNNPTENYEKNVTQNIITHIGRKIGLFL